MNEPTNNGDERGSTPFHLMDLEQFLLSLEDAIEKLVRFLDGQITLYPVSIRRLPAHIIPTMAACALKRMFMTHLIFGLAMNRVPSKFVEGKDFMSHWTAGS